MKKNTKLQMKNYHLTFDFTYLLIAVAVFCFSPLGAQRTEKVFTAELKVEEETEIYSTGVKAIKFYGNGTISFWDGKEKSNFSGKEKNGPIYQIDKHLRINTWDKNKVQQITTVVLECETKQQTENLMSALEMELTLDVVSKIKVDTDLNISAVEINNGWLRSDKSFLVLDDGRRFPIKYFSIKNELFIPKAQDLQLQLESNSVSLDDHEGELTINVEDGMFNAGAIKLLDASFIDSEVNIKKVEKGEVESKNSEVNILKSDKLSMNSISSNVQSASILDFELTGSLNDTYRLDQLMEVSIEDAKFSDFKIESIERQMRSALKNCGLSIAQFGADFEELRIINENAEVFINLESQLDYKMTLRSFNQSKYSGLDKLEKTNDDDSTVVYKVGNGKKALIELDCKFCQVKLRTSR